MEITDYINVTSYEIEHRMMYNVCACSYSVKGHEEVLKSAGLEQLNSTFV